MHTFILQDWTAVAGPSGAAVTQDETGWLDLAPFQDVVIYLDCREATPTGTPPTIYLETAPAKENSLFQALVSSVLAASSAPRVLRCLMLNSTTPLARYLRWRITGPTSAWDASFRVLVAANSPGM